jgi:hypothetical protein
MRAPLMAITLLLAGCGGKDNKVDLGVTDGPGVLDRSVDVKGVSPDLKPDVTVVDMGTPPHLTSTHKGWANPLCLSCHGKTASMPHTGKGYRPPDCVDCHGYNGAKHKSHATKTGGNCTASCHSGHDPSFKVPDDCITCHFHPANLGGT